MKTAFTLAEVLITIGIIGVIATISIQSLITKYQKFTTATKLKKTYNILLQGLERAEVQYGESIHWDYTLPENQFAKRYISPFYSVIKHYNRGELTYQVHSIYKNDINANIYFDYDILPRIILNDGVMVSVQKQAKVFVLVVDLNSIKSPNTYGKDLFAFSIQSDGRLVPYGIGDYQNTSGTYDRDFLMNGSDWRACQSTGVFCPGVIMIDNWQIKNDYPW